MSKYKRYGIIIILITNAILISIIELFIPVPIPIPGVKLGLANIITLLAIVFLNFKDVLLVVTIRSLVVALLTRGFMMLAFSLSGGILSAIIMTILYKSFNGVFSIKGISIAGAIIHNTTQVAVASMILGQIVMLYYLPVLLIAAVITGFITGSIAEITIQEIKEKGLFANG